MKHPILLRNTLLAYFTLLYLQNKNTSFLDLFIVQLKVRCLITLKSIYVLKKGLQVGLIRIDNSIEQLQLLVWESLISTVSFIRRSIHFSCQENSVISTLWSLPHYVQFHIPYLKERHSQQIKLVSVNCVSQSLVKSHSNKSFTYKPLTFHKRKY